MRYSAHLFQGWVYELRDLSAQVEQSVLFQLLTLDRVFVSHPAILRRLSDRGVPHEVRLNWLTEAMKHDLLPPLRNAIQYLLTHEAFSQWSKFFHDYLRFRERRGLGRLYLLSSHAQLSSKEEQRVQTFIEQRFSEPAHLYPVIDPHLAAGVRVESLDGWMLDATVAGRLTRLASSLVS